MTAPHCGQFKNRSADSFVRAFPPANLSHADKAVRTPVIRPLHSMLRHSGYWAWAIAAALIFQVAARAAEPFKTIDLWPGIPPGDNKVQLGPEHDATKPEDRPVAGKSVIRL